MARALTAQMLAAVTAGVVRPCLIAKITTVSGDLKLWNGRGDLVWGADTFAGVGHLGSVSSVNETQELRADKVTFTLSGIPQSLIATALSDMRWGKPALLWVGMLDDNGALITDPYQIFAGLTDVPVMDEGADTATLSIVAENRLADLERPRVRRFTHEDQQLRDPTDLGFEYVAALQDAKIMWGQGIAE